MQENQFQTHFKQIKNCIDTAGNPIAASEEVSHSIKKSEELARRLLGCTLTVRGRKFILRMLEIYNGGVGDDGHDWYRARFVYKKSKYRDHTAIQAEGGLKVYLSSLDTEDTYTRFDIVVGEQGVPVSFLVRSVWDENFKLIGRKEGSPNLVLKAMGLTGEDHGAAIEVDNPLAPINLQDTHEQILSEKGFIVKECPRKNLRSTFEKNHGVQWNVYLD